MPGGDRRGWRIAPGDLADTAVIALLTTHLHLSHATGSVHVLDLDGLRAPDIRFWTIHAGEDLVGCGALKRLSADHGEVKSMHATQSWRGHGVGSAMLAHIVATARGGGFARLSLETGSSDYFRPARALYARHGFIACGPFGRYVPDPNSCFLTLAL